MARCVENREVYFFVFILLRPLPRIEDSRLVQGWESFLGPRENDRTFAYKSVSNENHFDLLGLMLVYHPVTAVPFPHRYIGIHLSNYFIIFKKEKLKDGIFIFQTKVNSYYS